MTLCSICAPSGPSILINVPWTTYIACQFCILPTYIIINRRREWPYSHTINSEIRKLKNVFHFLSIIAHGLILSNPLSEYTYTVEAHMVQC